jgi:hypothetical protein
MRIKLESDPAHGTNSLYTGSAVRLTRKSGESNALVSKYLCSIGHGTADPVALALYNRVQSYIARFSQYSVDSIVSNTELMAQLYEMWMSCPQDFGRTHIEAAAPMTLASGALVVSSGFGMSSPTMTRVWQKFLRHRVIRLTTLPYLLVSVQHSMGMNNLYRILEAHHDYAIGIHVQEQCYFISYRDLLFIDYDHSSRLQILYGYTRKHNCTFRIVQTNKGYHAFLTSHPVQHQYCLQLLMRLCTDPCHAIGVFHRGYSVRVNQKYSGEKPYREIRKVGKAEEDPRLVELYQLHLQLYNENCKKKTRVHRYQSKTARKIVEEEGWDPSCHHAAGRLM